jgi:hypothetical protein
VEIFSPNTSEKILPPLTFEKTGDKRGSLGEYSPQKIGLEIQTDMCYNDRDAQ